MLIVTVTTQRSGTKLFSGCLKSGTEIVPYGEIFNPEYSGAASYHSFLMLNGLNKLVKLGATEYIDLYFQNIAIVHGAIHCDLMFNQLEIPCVGWNPFSVNFMYGYLRSRRAVIIHLSRLLKDLFISEKFLQIYGGAAHRFDNEYEMPFSSYTPVELDIDEFNLYRRKVEYQQRLLNEAMEGYPLFIKLEYDDLASCCLIPDYVLDVIMEGSIVNSASILRDRIQLYKPRSKPMGIDYRQIFTNYEDMPD